MTDDERELRLDAIRERYERAHEELDRMTSAPGGPAAAWRWSIPAKPDRDSDLLLAASLTDIPYLLEEIDRLAGLVDNGLSAAVWLGTQGLGVSHALDPETYEGDAGAVIEAGVQRGECA